MTYHPGRVWGQDSPTFKRLMEGYFQKKPYVHTLGSAPETMEGLIGVEFKIGNDGDIISEFTVSEDAPPETWDKLRRMQHLGKGL